ncbi:hypothetical protein SFRURICE_018129 [Spodoptera frugiperda]|nr:hypothetical protein SFRURICE_018129 [Spodoptera frugiperda]
MCPVYWNRLTAITWDLQHKRLALHVSKNHCLLLISTARLVRWLGSWLPRNGFDSRTEQLFVCSTNCCFGSGCHVYVNLHVCKRTNDTGENPSVGQR